MGSRPFWIASSNALIREAQALPKTSLPICAKAPPAMAEPGALTVKAGDGQPLWWRADYR